MPTVSEPNGLSSPLVRVNYSDPNHKKAMFRRVGTAVGRTTMRHLIRGGGSATSRRGSRTRTVALVATFLLLMAGMVVSTPGLITASATSTSDSPKSDSNHDGEDDGHDDGKDHGHDDGDKCETDVGHHDGDDDADHDGTDDGHATTAPMTAAPMTAATMAPMSRAIHPTAVTLRRHSRSSMAAVTAPTAAAMTVATMAPMTGMTMAPMTAATMAPMTVRRWHR